MERGILEEYILYQTHVDVGVDDVAGVLKISERHLALKHDEGPGLCLAHAHACIYHGHDPRVLHLTRTLVAEQLAEIFPFLIRTDVYEEALYLILEKDNQYYQADTHELVENSACKPHLKDFGGYDPEGEKHQHSVEQAQSAAAFHKFVDIEKQQRDNQYVDYVFYSKTDHRLGRLNVRLSGKQRQGQRLDSQRAFMSRTVSTAGATSWTRTMSAPL